MKRYWQFGVVGIICLLVALLWAQPPRSHGLPSHGVAVAAEFAPQSTPAKNPSTGSQTPAGSQPAAKAGNDDDQPLPGSSSSLPLLAVIGFGVLAGGITSAMRTR